MKLRKELLEDIVRRAEYYPGEKPEWKDCLVDILACYASENDTVERIVAFEGIMSSERKGNYPPFVVKSLLGFLSYVHKRNRWASKVIPGVVGDLYYDYLEQLCGISSMFLLKFIFLSDKEIVYLEPEDVTKLCSAYPVWARRVAELTLQWCTVQDEMLQRLSDDMGLEHITRLYSMGADLHNHGRRVFFVELNGSRRVLYKPHPLDTDCGWINLCNWFREETGTEICYAQTANHGAYGYVEYINYRNPPADELPLFFYHCGVLLCLVYWTKGADMHCENIIAQGIWPCLVDLEMITGENEEFSVLGTAMLRYKKYRKGEEIDDFGAFTSNNPQWFSLPRRDDRVVTAVEYREEVINGFQKTYRLLMKMSPRKTDFFKFASPRYLFRPTSYYVALLKRLLSEDTLSDGKKYYEETKRSLNSVPKNERALESELRAILRGDVPLFYQQRQTRDLYDPDGMIESGFFVGYPGHVLQRELTEMDLQKQLSIIWQELGSEKQHKSIS